MPKRSYLSPASISSIIFMLVLATCQLPVDPVKDPDNLVATFKIIDPENTVNAVDLRFTWRELLFFT